MQTSERISQIIADADEAWRRLPRHYLEAGAAWTRADPHVVAHELRRVIGRKRRLLEWGSGIGTHCLIADTLGMEAHGIEIDAVLVGAAKELAGRLNAHAKFGEGSFVPTQFSLPQAEDDDGDFLADGGPDGYAALIAELHGSDDAARHDLHVRPETIAATYDVIYAYPAPQHVDWFAALFRDLAREGAIFWCYTETAGILESIKTGPHSITPLRPA